MLDLMEKWWVQWFDYRSYSSASVATPRCYAPGTSSHGKAGGLIVVFFLKVTGFQWSLASWQANVTQRDITEYLYEICMCQKGKHITPPSVWQFSGILFESFFRMSGGEPLCNNHLGALFAEWGVRTGLESCRRWGCFLGYFLPFQNWC